MPKLPNLGQLLAELITFHYERPARPSRVSDPGVPRLRLQDWRVVEEVSMGGATYVLLRRDGRSRNGLAALTAREREAARHACAGASNKEIAHQMGISPSTVGVLLSRASRKLGALNRSDLIRILRSPQT
jgi:DNA-binding CsgD family transcriptional regulator